MTWKLSCLAIPFTFRYRNKGSCPAMSRIRSCHRHQGSSFRMCQDVTLQTDVLDGGNGRSQMWELWGIRSGRSIEWSSLDQPQQRLDHCNVLFSPSSRQRGVPLRDGIHIGESDNRWSWKWIISNWCHFEETRSDISQTLQNTNLVSYHTKYQLENEVSDQFPIKCQHHPRNAIIKKIMKLLCKIWVFQAQSWSAVHERFMSCSWAACKWFMSASWAVRQWFVAFSGSLMCSFVCWDMGIVQIYR